MFDLIHYSDRVCAIQNFLTEQECNELIQLAETTGFYAAPVRVNSGTTRMPEIRNNERTMCATPTWIEIIWQRLQTINLPTLDGENAVGLPKELRFYKYSPSQRFKMHKDGAWTENGLTSKFTFLVYLNDNFVGGATKFKDFIVQPETGSALIFIHDTWHQGAILESGTKYVLRSDILYAPITSKTL